MKMRNLVFFFEFADEKRKKKVFIMKFQQEKLIFNVIFVKMTCLEKF